MDLAKEPRWLLSSPLSYVNWHLFLFTLAFFFQLEHPDSWPGFIIDGKPVHPPLLVFTFHLLFLIYPPSPFHRDFFIPVSGFLPVDVSLAPIFSKSEIKTPSLHILGDTDVIVVKERSEALIDVCDETTRRVERHEGGHFVPSKTNWRKFLKEYITNFTPGVEILSPEYSISNDSSRSGTPAHVL